MKENKLASLSIEFSLTVLDNLSNVKGHSVIVNQLERPATSIGANIHEANYAQSKADFVAKMQIALKECYESEYWFEIFGRAHLIDDGSIKDLKNGCGTIRRLLIASINTSKNSI